MPRNHETLEKIIQDHFERLDLDIRNKQQGYSRYMDQKVTPDVLAFVSDCVWNLPSSTNFSVREIWELEYFKKNTVFHFNKPCPSDFTASSEYNKFIGQPLKTLAYAKVLNEKKQGNRNIYSVENEQLLEHISLSSKNAYRFLYQYIVKVLSDSGFIRYFERYKDEPNQNHFIELKSAFNSFMRGNTNINGSTEINRIFPKVLNPYAVNHRLPGCEMGKITKFSFSFSDLGYNRRNFRDLKKDKGQSRQTADQSRESHESKLVEYEIKKAKLRIQKRHPDSELKDQWAKGNAIHVHHIFPKSKFPKFATTLENLIHLTAEQHVSKAHTKSNFQFADPDYQIECLIAKCDSIEISVLNSENFYSREAFIELINNCLNLDLDSCSSFDDIKTKLRQL